MNRREIILGGASAAAVLGATGLSAQQPAEVVIGAVYQMSGASAQVGVDAQHAFDTALDIINNAHDIDLPLAKNAGLAGLGGAKVHVIVADHQGDPQKGRAEAERLITQREGRGAHRLLSERGRRHHQPDGRALSDSLPLGRQLLAEPAPPGAEILFPRRRA